MSGSKRSSLDTFKKWRRYVTEVGTNPHHWQHAGDWFFPAPSNKWTAHTGKFYHICQDNWKLDLDENLSAQPCTEVCEACGTEIPDGIKMIASLLSW
jgi:hypothetical protein